MFHPLVFARSISFPQYLGHTMFVRYPGDSFQKINTALRGPQHMGVLLYDHSVRLVTFSPPPSLFLRTTIIMVFLLLRGADDAEPRNFGSGRQPTHSTWPRWHHVLYLPLRAAISHSMLFPSVYLRLRRYVVPFANLRTYITLLSRPTLASSRSSVFFK